MYRRAEQNYETPHKLVNPDGEQVTADLAYPFNYDENEYMPFLDTFGEFSYPELINSGSQFHDTDGCRCGEECLNCGEHFNAESEGAWIECEDCYVCDSCLEDYVLVNDAWYPIDECHDIDGEWYHEDDCAYDDMQAEYILSDDAVELADGQITHMDYAVYCENTCEYLHVDDEDVAECPDCGEYYDSSYGECCVKKQFPAVKKILPELKPLSRGLIEWNKHAPLEVFAVIKAESEYSKWDTTRGIIIDLRNLMTYTYNQDFSIRCTQTTNLEQLKSMFINTVNNRNVTVSQTQLVA